MGFSYTILIVLTIITFVSWLNYRLLSRLFPFYRIRMVKYSWLLFAAETNLAIVYSLSRHPPFVVPEVEGFRFFVYGALIWLFGQLILLILQPLIYVAHRLLKSNRRADTPETSSSVSGMSRRNFLQRSLAATPLIAFGIGTKGIYEAQTAMVVRRHSLVMPELPHNLSGFKIGQVSDIHLGPYFDLAKLDTVLRLLAKEKPDLVVITGDFTDDLALLKPAIDKFDELQPSIPHGIYFCMGNHDYFHNARLVRAELDSSRIVLMDNIHKLIVPGPRPLYLIGVDYPWADFAHNGIKVDDNKRKQYFSAANQAVPQSAFKVLIGHHPDVLFDGFAARIPLTLAGHTHGGQVIIAGRSLLTPFHYMRGLYSEGGVYGYVSSGVGHWFPFRIGCPPEISVFTLMA